MKPILPKSSVTGVGYPQIHSIVASPGTTIILATTMAPTNFANFAIGTQGAAQPTPIILPSPSTPTITLSTHSVPQPTPVILPLTNTKQGTSRNLQSRCPPLLAPKSILPRSELVNQQRSIKSVKGTNSSSKKHASNVKGIKIMQNVQLKASLNRDAKKSVDQELFVKSILPKAPQRDAQTLIIVPVPAPTQKSSVVSSLLFAPNSSVVDVRTHLDHPRKVTKKKKIENSIAKENKKSLPLKVKHEIKVAHNTKLTNRVKSDPEDVVKNKFARQTKNKSKLIPVTVSKNDHAKLSETDQDVQCKQSDKSPVVPHENMPTVSSHSQLSVPSRNASLHLADRLSPQHGAPHDLPPPYPQYSNIQESDLNLHHTELLHGCETGKTEKEIQFSKTSNQKLSEITKKLSDCKCKKGQGISECPASIPDQTASPEKFLTNAVCARNKVDGLQATLPCLSSQSSRSISSSALHPPYTSSTVSKLELSQKNVHSNTITGTSSCFSIVSPIYSPSSSLLKLHSKDPSTYIIPSSFHATNPTIEGALDSPFSCVKNHSYSSIYSSLPCTHSSAGSSCSPLPSCCSASSGFLHSSPSTCQSQNSGDVSAASPVLSSAVSDIGTCVATPGSQLCHQVSYSHHPKSIHHALSSETPHLTQSSELSSTSHPSKLSTCSSHSYTAFYNQSSQPNQSNKVPQKSLHTYPLCSASQILSSHPVSYTRSHQSFQQASHIQSSQSPSYMHSTRPTLCVQSPRPTSYSPSQLIPHTLSPKSTSHMQSPQHASHTQTLHLISGTQSPQPTSYTQSPQPTSYTQSPQPTSYTQSPQPTSYTQSPQPTSYTQSPQPTSYTQSPQPTSYTQSSQPTSYTQSSQPTSCTQSSRLPYIQSSQPTYSKSPQSPLYTQSSQPVSFTQSPLRHSHTHVLQSTLHTQSTQSVVYTQSAQQTCYTQSSQSNSDRQPCESASNIDSPHPATYIPTHHSASYAQSPRPSLYTYSPQSGSFVQSRHPNSFATPEHPTTCSQSPQPEGYFLHTQHINDADPPSPQALSFVNEHIPSYCQSPQQETYSQSPHATPTPIKASSTNTDDSRLSHLPPFSIPQISSAFHHTNPASISHDNVYDSHQLSDTNYSQYYGSNKGLPLSSSYPTDEINSSFVSIEKSLSPPSYEAHLQNTASYPSSSPQTSASHHMSITHQQITPTNYSLSNHTTSLEEEDSSIHSDNRKSVRSPPAYPSSPALLPPPRYTPYSEATPVTHLSDHAIVLDKSKGSYGYSSKELPHAFFQNNPSMPQPPVTSPHTDARRGVLLPNCQDYSTSQCPSSASNAAFPNKIYHSLHDVQHSSDNEVEFQGVHNRTNKSTDQQTLFKHYNQEMDVSLAEWRNSKRGAGIHNNENFKVHSLIERAERLWFIPQQEQNRVYMKRKEMARDFLNHPDLHLSRDMMLKEKFWIEEDEPIAEEILLTSNTENEQEQQQEHPKEEVTVSEYSTSAAVVDVGPDYEAASDRLSSKKKHTREMLCQVCGKMLKGRSSLKSHLNSHHRIKPHACPFCHKSFTNRGVLVAHLRIHTGEMPYVCRICDTSFRTQSGLTRHKSLHTNARPYECSMCSKAFKTKLVLQQHLKLHLTGLFTCSECGKTFERHKSLAVHKASHNHKSQRFPCPHCHKAYQFRSLLNIHMQVHSNIRKHVCSVCNESFVWRSGLAAHLKIHSTSRPKCDICGMHFASEKRLSTHYRRHSNPQPHRCEVCGRSFSHAYRLVSHSLVHQEHKEYTCPKCGVVFTSAKKIRKHLVSHRKEVPRICQLSGTIEIPKSTT
ncbi:uncharacterized protein [Procambarus clarkii]|uniref:uncharacterized protein n=1 Tax=Procambarus clarkii TaxID=6728 RepID=UPI003744116D